MPSQSRRNNNRIGLAVLAERLDAISQKQDDLTYFIRGNGKPGLVDRVTEIEMLQKAQSETLRRLVDTVDRLAKAAEEEREERKRVDRKVDEHLAPGNLQHATIAAALVKNPREWMKFAGWAVAFLLAARAGFLRDLASVLLGIP